MPTQTPTTNSINTKLLLKVLVAFKKGDFSVRLPGEWTGEAGKIADTLNDIIELSDRTTKEVERVAAWVKEAEAGGAKLLCGGKKISDTCYAPTVLWNPAQDSKVSTEEIFGPVVCIYPYRDRDEAIQEANRLDYHFQAAVFTQNLEVALDTVQKLNATAVMVNDHTAFRVDWMPREKVWAESLTPCTR